MISWTPVRMVESTPAFPAGLSLVACVLRAHARLPITFFPILVTRRHGPPPYSVNGTVAAA
jgi:hypothetical protein